MPRPGPERRTRAYPALCSRQGSRLVCAAGRALVTQRVPFVGDPALDSSGCGRGGVVGGWVVARAVEGVEAGWWEA